MDLPEPARLDMLPEPYGWCLSSGFQHQDDEHCPECTGDHSAGACMTPELAHGLIRLDGLRSRVDRCVEPRHAAAVEFLRRRDGA